MKMGLSVFFSGYLSLVLFGLAGCQSQGVNLQLGDQVYADEFGIKVDPIYELTTSDISHTYVKRGELEFRLIRLTNTSRTPVEFIPSVHLLVGEVALRLSQRFYSMFSRDKTRMDLPPSDWFTLYKSEFDMSEPRVTTADGGVRPIIPFGSGATSLENQKGILLNPGEFAEIQVSLRLSPGYALLPSLAEDKFGEIGGVFYPPERADPSSFNKVEWLAATRYHSDLAVNLFVRKQSDRSIHPVMQEPFFTMTALRHVPQSITFSGFGPYIPYPVPESDLGDASYRFQFPGLPVLL